MHQYLLILFWGVFVCLHWGLNAVSGLEAVEGVFFMSSSANVVCCWEGRVEHWCRAFMVQSCWHKMAADWNVLHLPHTVSTSPHTRTVFSVLGFWYLLLQTLQSFCRPLENMWTTGPRMLAVAWHHKQETSKLNVSENATPAETVVAVFPTGEHWKPYFVAEPLIVLLKMRFDLWFSAWYFHFKMQRFKMIGALRWLPSFTTFICEAFGRTVFLLARQVKVKLCS